MIIRRLSLRLQSPQNRMAAGLITGSDKGRYFSAAVSRQFTNPKKVTREDDQLSTAPRMKPAKVAGKQQKGRHPFR
jgi:hypothetical protein